MVGIACLGWMVITHSETVVEPLIVPVDRVILSMHVVKQQLRRLWGTSFAGVVLTELLLDQRGMHIQGNAQSVVALETWLTQVREGFSVDEKSVQTSETNGVTFEMVLHAIP